MIRPYQPSDIDDVIRVWYEVAQNAYDFLPVPTLQAICDDIKHTYMPASESWVCEEDGQVVGFISLLDNVVGGLFVIPAYQNLGIGKSLVMHAKQQRETVSLSVLKESTRVLKFYERCGFQATRESLCPLTNLATVMVEF